MPTTTDVTQLLDEYETLVTETSGKDGGLDWERLQGALTATGAWTPVGAQELIDVVRGYGAFVLRNALALAVAAEIEDGSRGL